MCAIAGILAYGAAAPPIRETELVACRDHMAARGPDDQGLWIEPHGRIGLAHRRLSIIDLDPRSSQPMTTAEQDLVIVFNGEIYNYKTLRSQLQQQGATFRTQSDTEVLLHLYRTRGEDMVAELRGMYAFAIWDAARRELFLARDAYGIKPLYYSNEGGTFRFASQVKALMAGGAIRRDACAAGWTGYHLLGSVPEPWTTFEAVKCLPAGGTMRIGRDGPRAPSTTYSIGRTLAEGAAHAAARQWTEEEVEEAARAALLESMRYHMVADVPVGAFLSGGIDSGALVGLMRDAGQTDIQTLTLSFQEFSGRAEDEAPVAEEVARTYGTRHTRRLVSEQEFRADLPKLLDAMDQPSIDGINTWFIAKAAKEQGLKVVVSGLGGDELFGGYPSFRQIPQLVHWLGPLARAPLIGRSVRHAVSLVGPGRLGLNAKSAGLVELGSTFSGSYLLRRGLYMPWELGRIMPFDMARRGLAELAPLDMIERAADAASAPDFAVISALESSLYMRNQLLRDTDWTSMAHSLEARVPLVDRHLLEQIARLPLSRHSFAGKKLLRNAPRTPLPRSVWDKPKTGFTTPIESWIKGLSPSGSARRNTVRQHWSRDWALEVRERFNAIGSDFPSDRRENSGWAAA